MNGRRVRFDFSPSRLVVGMLWLALGLVSRASCFGDDPPIAFPVETIRGSELVLKPPATVLIGEMHGTWETPLLVASLVRSARTDQAPPVLCVEIPTSEQRALNQFLHSDGGEPAVRALRASAHWSGTDGRASMGLFAMIELVRRLNRQGADVRVVAMDIHLEIPNADPNLITPKQLERLQDQVKGRDRAMADAVLAARREFPKSNVIVLAGNIHTRLRKGLRGDADYAPMGWHLAQALPDVISLNVQFADGEAWVATDQGVGPTRMKGADRGAEPFIEVFPKPQDGYQGLFYVGKISAARPLSETQGR